MIGVFVFAVLIEERDGVHLSSSFFYTPEALMSMGFPNLIRQRRGHSNPRGQDASYRLWDTLRYRTSLFLGFASGTNFVSVSDVFFFFFFCTK